MADPPLTAAGFIFSWVIQTFSFFFFSVRLSKIIIASFRMEEAFKVMKHKDQP